MNEMGPDHTAAGRWEWFREGHLWLWGTLGDNGAWFDYDSKGFASMKIIRVEMIQRMAVILLSALALGLFFPSAARAASSAGLHDLFSERELVTTADGRASGSNVGATLEIKEPQHGGKPGGHSVWISWKAPADGIVTFDTAGSSFDTLLGGYVLQDGDKPPMERLKEVARGDDDGNLRTSRVQFGVRAGTVYEIAVDGFGGAVGDIRLNWKLVASSDPPPIVVNLPQDRALQLGEKLTITVDFQPGGPVRLAWFFNGNELLGEESATLVIPSFQVENLGLYSLRFTAGNVRFFTPAVEIQVNSEGLTATLARDKLQDAPGSALHGDDGGGGGRGPNQVPGRGIALPQANPIGGVTRGYNGTQIFNTLFATSDPGEPRHCNVVGGASYWFAYDAPTNGVLTLDTIGTAFDTVLAVYTYDGIFVGYPSLREVACDNDSAPDGIRSHLQFTTEAGRSYLAVVDGVNGARGITHLNYSFVASAPVIDPPLIVQQPLSLTVNAGESASLSVQATGAGPLHFLWRQNLVDLTNRDVPVLTLAAVSANDAGDYQVVVSGAGGSVTSVLAQLRIILPPKLIAPPADLAVRLGMPLNLSVQADGTPPLRFAWLHEGALLGAETNATLSLSAVTPADAGAYVVEVSNSAGKIVSPAAAVSVWSLPEFHRGGAGSDPVLQFVAAGPIPYLIEFTSDVTAPWTAWPDPLPNDHGVVTVPILAPGVPARFVRVRFQ